MYGQQFGGGWEEYGPSSATKLALVSCFSLGYGMLAERAVIPNPSLLPTPGLQLPRGGEWGMSLEGTSVPILPGSESCTRPRPHTQRGVDVQDSGATRGKASKWD